MSDDTDTTTTDPDERATEDGAAGAGAAASTDPDALFDRLVAEGVLTVDENGEVRTTESFDSGYGVYYDSYVNVDDDEFHETVAATFGLSDADAAENAVESRGITREDLARYLALRSELPDDTPADDVAVMAGMVGEAVPDSPVPADVADVTDDPGSVLAGDRVVVTAWKRFCDPCDRLADELDALREAVPDDVPVAGVDGEVATEFCATYGVESAPAVVLVAGDEHRTVSGADVDKLTAAICEFF